MSISLFWITSHICNSFHYLLVIMFLLEPSAVVEWSRRLEMSDVLWQYQNDFGDYVAMPSYYNLKYEEHFRADD